MTTRNDRSVRYRRLALAETDPERVKLLHQIADESDRGVLVTAEWLTPARLLRVQDGPV